MSRSNKQLLFNIMKWLSLPLVLGVLYYQLFIQHDFQETAQVFKDNFSKDNAILLILAIALMPLNLAIEACIALSIFTPKRIGEYGGRAMILESNRMASMVSTFVGNMGQSVVNIMVGLSAFWIFLSRFHMSDTDYSNAIPLAIASIVISLLAYFNLSYVYDKLSRFKFFKKFSNYFSVIDVYSKGMLLKVLLLSFLKYLVFVTQYMLLVYFFGVDITWFWSLICVSCVFFAKSMLPLPASVELAARGAIAVYFFDYLTSNDIGILVASYLLWIINLAVPAAIGSYLLTKIKWRS